MNKVIACKSSFPPYLAALNPTDQVFDFEELEYHYLVANRTEDAPSKEEEDDDEEDGANGSKGDVKVGGTGGDEKADKLDPDKEKSKSIDDQQTSPVETIQDSPQLKSPNIDNPFLKAATKPKAGKSDVSINLNF